MFGAMQVAPAGHSIARMRSGAHGSRFVAIIECECSKLIAGYGDAITDAEAECASAHESHLTDVDAEAREQLETWLNEQIAETKRFGHRPASTPMPWAHPRETRPR